MGTNNQRLFGEMPTFTFNGAIAVSTLPEDGTAIITIVADTIFSEITFRWPVAGSVSLAGLTIPAGTILYGVASYTVTSGAGIAYNSSF